jgi:hypothetical protein
LLTNMAGFARPDTDAFWEAAGRAVAGLHAVRADRFGWPRDGRLGLLGWRGRMPLLHLRELLSVVAHFGAVPDCLAEIREVVRTFR